MASNRHVRHWQRGVLTVNSRRSDLGIIVMCVIPVILALVLWLMWANGSSLPVPLPGNKPSIGASPPSVPPDTVLPEGVQNFVNAIRDNVVLVATGVTVAIVAVIMLSGIWADAAQSRRDDVDESNGHGESDTPWLDDYQ